MPVNPNMKAIQTVTVGAGGVSSIDFQNIPQTYTDLMLLVSARDNRGFTFDNLAPAFNGSTSNFTTIGLYAYSGVTSAGGSGANYQYATGANATANTFSNFQWYIPNYTSSNNKSWSNDSVTEDNSANNIISISANLWSNSAAINRITLTPVNGTLFSQYSTATLYGITSAAVGAKATGGVITEDNNYWYHTFTSSGTFTPTQNLTADCLVIGAGGGGSGGTNQVNYGSGGASGVLRYSAAQSVSNGTAYTVTIGAGGTGGSGSPSNTGGNGTSSSITGSGFTTITATGGNGSGASGTGGSNADFSGGSLGGLNSGGGAGAAGNGSGANGGTGSSSYSSWTAASAGFVNGIIGGGGGGTPDTGNSSGTVNGGGGRFDGGSDMTIKSGRSNSGGGGGGSQIGTQAGNGGSGVVIFRYAK